MDGSEADIDGLMQAAALVLYRKTQPYRWAVYEMNVARREDLAVPVLRGIAAGGPTVERAWALNGLANAGSSVQEDVALVRRAITLAPGLAILHNHIYQLLDRMGRSEEAHAEILQAQRLMSRPDHGGMVTITGPLNEATLASQAGDQATRLTLLEGFVIQPGLPTERPAAARMALALSALHRTGEAQATWIYSDDADATRAAIGAQTYMVRTAIAREVEAWPEALRQIAAVDALLRSPSRPDAYWRERVSLLPTEVWPDLAAALAHTGRLHEAQALIGKTPTDCYLCLRRRAEVAEVAGDRAGMDRGYAEAVRQAPSLVAAQIEWGQALLRRGAPDAALRQFQAALRIGPRAADAFEGWGEALAAKGDMAGAVKQYVQSAELNPRWGRLHLKWGEALAKQGKAAEARDQFKAAATMDLTAPERAELAAQEV